MPRLGSDQRPAWARVASHEKAEAIVMMCNRYGWKVVVGVAPDAPEDLTDLHRLFAKRRPQPLLTPLTAGRNAPCPCGSGKKYKACCLER